MSLPIPDRVPKPGLYYHYKHDPNGPINNYAYEVIGVGFHTEEDARKGEEHFVNYRPLYRSSVVEASEKLGIECFDNRPLKKWMADVEKDGKTFPRFRLITDPLVIHDIWRHHLYLDKGLSS